MTTKRQEVWTLVYQVAEAAKTLALAERDYNDLNNKLMVNLDGAFPIDGKEI